VEISDGVDGPVKVKYQKGKYQYQEKADMTPS
jgi:hypothetical protein